MIVIYFNITVGKAASSAMLAFYMLLDIAAFISIAMAEATIVDLSTVVYVQYKSKTVQCWQTYCLLAMQILYFVLYFSNVI